MNHERTIDGIRGLIRIWITGTGPGTMPRPQRLAACHERMGGERREDIAEAVALEVAAGTITEAEGELI